VYGQGEEPDKDPKFVGVSLSPPKNQNEQIRDISPEETEATTQAVKTTQIEGVGYTEG